MDIATGSAVFATIYFQRVHRLAQPAGADEGEVFSAQDAAAIRDRVEAARLSPNIVWTTR